MEKTAPPTLTTSERFFAWMRSLGIQREKGWIGGVAAGIAVRIGIDPLIVRGILVVTALLGAPALLVYAAAWLLLPDSDDSIHLERAIKGQFDSSLAAIGVVILLGLLPIAPGLWFGVSVWPEALGRVIWTLVLIGLAVWFVVWIAQRDSLPKAGPTAPPAPPSNAPASEFAEWRTQQAAWREENAAFRRNEADARAAAWRLKTEEATARHRAENAQRQAEYRASSPHPLWSLLVIGLALVAGGVTTLLVGGGVLAPTPVVSGLAVVVAVLGLGVIVNGVRGKRGGGPSGLASVLITPLVIVLVLPLFSNVSFTGDRAIAPTDLPGSRPDVYFVASGDVRVDLTDFYGSTDEGTLGDDVYVFVGSGDVRVLLPADEEVSTRSSIGNGETFYVSEDGSDVDFSTISSDRVISIHVFVGNGDVTFVQEEK
jgi:phage shock protein PspC (stress-responsive transcriptional regulator)